MGVLCSVRCSVKKIAKRAWLGVGVGGGKDGGWVGRRVLVLIEERMLREISWAVIVALKEDTTEHWFR